MLEKFPPILLDDCFQLQDVLHRNLKDNNSQIGQILNVFDVEDLQLLSSLNFNPRLYILRLFDISLLWDLDSLKFAETPVILSQCIDLSGYEKLSREAGLAIEIAGRQDLLIANRQICDLVIAKGFEAPGPSNEQSAFTLFQLASIESRHPFYMHGDTAYELFQAYLVNGVSGLVISGNQFSSDDFRKMTRVRINDIISIRLRLSSVVEIEQFQASLSGSAVVALKASFQQGLWTGQIEDLWRERRELVKEYINVYRYTFRKVPSACFFKGSLGARSLSSSYPIVQGPMANITCSPDFAEAVYHEGGLPILALAELSLASCQELIKKTARKNIQFGVGIVAISLSDEDFDAQVRLFEKTKPTMVLVGTPQLNHVTRLLDSSLNIVVHAPTLAIFKSLYNLGIRTFVVEGEEAGGHVSQTSSLTAWQQILHEIRDRSLQSEIHLIFAGGIEGKSGSSLISSMLRFYGVRDNFAVSLQLGTKYLSTKEILEKTNLSSEYQNLLFAINSTTLTGEYFNRTIRQLETDTIHEMQEKEWDIFMSSIDLPEQKNKFSKLYRGGLAKAVTSKEYCHDGCYQAGSIVSCIQQQTSIEELHHSLVQQRCDEEKDDLDDAIAVVGIGVLLPGAISVEQYFRNLILKRCFIREASPDSLQQELFYSENRDDQSMSYSRIVAALDNIDTDMTEFRIPPSVSGEMSLPQIVSLKCAKLALEDAGFFRRPFSKERVAVILGVHGKASSKANEKVYWQIVKDRLVQLAEDDQELKDRVFELIDRFEFKYDDEWEFTEDTHPGELGNICASRINSTFDFKGPSYAINAACASSLAGFGNAISMLLSDRCDIAIAGGTEIGLDSCSFIKYSSIQALSDDGSFPFDARANGFVLGEGSGIFVLKRYKDSLQHGDQIYALIRGWGASSDGAGKAISAPSSKGQLTAMNEAYEDAGIDLRKVDYVEAHGTGTKVGDNIELESYEKFFGRQRLKENLHLLNLGASKANVGHARSAAGVIGSLAGIFAINTSCIPPQTNFEQPVLNLNSHGLNINTRPKSIEGDEIVSGVSAFGFGGINYHIVLSSAPENSRPPIIDRTIADFPLIDNLKNDTAFLFPGQGSQYPGMLYEFRNDQYVNNLMKKAENIFAEFCGKSFRDLLFCKIKVEDNDVQNLREEQMKATDLSQPALFFTSAILMQKLVDENINPAMVIGHSLGEYSALYAAGTLSFADAFRLVCIRGKLMANSNFTDPGSMLALSVDGYSAEKLINEIEGYLSCANFNSYNQTIIAGNKNAVDELAILAGKRDIRATSLNVARAFHCRLISECVDPMGQALLEYEFRYPTVPVPANISRQLFPFRADLSGKVMSDEDRICTNDLMKMQIDHPVDFVSQINVAYESGIRRFVEVGPKKILSRLTESILGGRPVQISSLLDPGESHQKRVQNLAVFLGETITIQRLPARTSTRLATNKKKNITAAVIKQPANILEQIRIVVSDVSGYAPEQVDDDSEFERDLGIDTLKIFEILARLRGTVLPQELKNFRDLTSVKKILVVANESNLAGEETDPANVLEELSCYKFKMRKIGRLPLEVPTESYFFDLEFIDNSENKNPFTLCDQKNNRVVIIHKLPVDNQSITKLLARLLSKIQNYLAIQQKLEHPEINLVSYCPVKAFNDSAYHAETAFMRSAQNDNPDFRFSYTHFDAPFPDEALIRRALQKKVIGRHVNSNDEVLEGRLYQLNGLFASVESLPDYLTNSDTILFTGGSGGIGTSICQYLLSHTTVNLVIVGRKKNGPSWAEAYSGRVSYFSVDVCDRDAVQREKIDKLGINLLVHAAGIDISNHFKNKTEDELKNVLDPKLKGLDNFIELLGESLKGIVLFSSANAYKGNHGQADYAAANAVFNGQKLSSIPTLSIGWAAWRDVGMASSGVVKKVIETSGASMIDAESGTRCFIKLLSGFLQTPPQGTSAIAVCGPRERNYYLPEHIIVDYGSEALLNNYLLSDPDNKISEKILIDFDGNEVLTDHRFSSKIIVPACIMLRMLYEPMIRMISEPESKCIKISDSQFFLQFEAEDKEFKDLVCIRKDDFFQLELKENGRQKPIFSTSASIADYSPEVREKHQAILEEMRKDAEWRMLPSEPSSGGNRYIDNFNAGFRVLKEMMYNGKVLKSKLNFEFAKKNPSIFTTPVYIPFLLESAFQVAAKWGFLHMNEDRIYMPKQIGDSYIFADQCERASNAVVYSRMRRRTNEVHIDLMVVDQDYNILIAIEDFVSCPTAHVRNHASANVVLSSPQCINFVEILVAKINESSEHSAQNSDVLLTSSELKEISEFGSQKRRGEKYGGKLLAKSLCQLRDSHPLALAKYEILSNSSPITAKRDGKSLEGHSFISLSHSDNLVCCAIHYRSVGIDIERIRPLLPKVILDCCGQSLVNKIPRYIRQNLNRFKDVELDDLLPILIFTQKEAVLKAVGIGLSDGISGLLIDDFYLNTPFNINYKGRQFEVFSIYDWGHVISIAKETSMAADISREDVKPDKVLKSEVTISELQMDIMNAEEKYGVTGCFYFSNIIDIQGHINPEFIQQSIDHVLKRHDILRTVFIKENGVYQGYVRDFRHIPMERIDCLGLNSKRRTNYVEEHIDIDKKISFDLETGPLLAVRLFRFGNNDWALAIVYHHIIMDCLISHDFNREMWSYYEILSGGKKLPDSCLPLQYSDFANRLNERLSNDRKNIVDKYWRQQLSGTSVIPFCNHKVVSDQIFEVIQFDIKHTVFEKVELYSRKQSTTLFATLCSAFSLCLMTIHNLKDISLAIPFSMMDRVKEKGLLGPFIKTFPLRIKEQETCDFNSMVNFVHLSIFKIFEHSDIDMNSLNKIALEETSKPLNTDFLCQFINLGIEDEEGFNSIKMESRTVESRNAMLFKCCTTFTKSKAGLNVSFAFNRKFINSGEVSAIAEQTKEILKKITPE